MIEGVTILAMENITKPALWTDILGWGSLIIGLIGLAMFFMAIGIDSYRLGVSSGIIMFIFWLVGIISSCVLQEYFQVPDYTQYEVILDDSVSMNEFMNTYEVLERRGQIYVVKEIEE